MANLTFWRPELHMEEESSMHSNTVRGNSASGRCPLGSSSLVLVLNICWGSSASGLLTNSPAYLITFHLTAENCILQIQRKNQVLFVYHILKSLRPTSSSPRACSRPTSHVPRPHVPESPFPNVPVSSSPHIPAPASPSAHIPASPSPTSHVPVPKSSSHF